MATATVEWPSVRDVMRDLDMSQTYVNRLVNQGRLRAVRTRLGWLVDPESVAEFRASREARPQLQRKRSA